jgi:hypothetical protein
MYNNLMMNRKGTVMKVSQKLRLIMNGVHLYTTVKQIRNGIGDEYRTNAAAQKCLASLEYMREMEPVKPVGLTGTWEGRNVQIDML